MGSRKASFCFGLLAHGNDSVEKGENLRMWGSERSQSYRGEQVALDNSTVGSFWITRGR